MFTRRSPTFLIVRFNYSTARSLGLSLLHLSHFFNSPSTSPFSDRRTLGLIRLPLPPPQRAGRSGRHSGTWHYEGMLWYVISKQQRGDWGYGGKEVVCEPQLSALWLWYRCGLNSICSTLDQCFMSLIKVESPCSYNPRAPSLTSDVLLAGNGGCRIVKTTDATNLRWGD